MPVQIHGKQYITVSERVEEAHKACKQLSITTEVLPNGGSIVIKATVTTEKGTFTGISAANPAKAIEKLNPYEVAETSAVGRALGFAGFGIVEGIASADEMVKAGVQDESKENTESEIKVCSAHDSDPVPMKYAQSKSTGKGYWGHRNEEGKICFGSGWMD